MNLDAIERTLCAAFSIVVVLSNLLSAKMVPLPLVDCAIPAGLVIYPLAFLLSNGVSELFGWRRARQMVYIAFAMNLLSFGLIELTLLLPSAEMGQEGSFEAIFGLSRLRILSSLVAYSTAQMAEVYLYRAIRGWTSDKNLWLRSSGATCIAQLIDTIVIDLCYLHLGLGMGIAQIVPIILFSYSYKVAFTLVGTPIFCLLVRPLKLRLG